MILEIQSISNTHENGQIITKDVLIVKDDSGVEITRENWNSDHPFFNLNIQNPSPIEEYFIRSRYNL